MPDHQGDAVSTLVMDRVFDKTDKGREEIATRKYKVAPRLRTLLVMIDGRRPLAELMRNFAALGVTEDAFTDLLEQDLIAPVELAAAARVAPAAAPVVRVVPVALLIPETTLAPPVPSVVPVPPVRETLSDADRFRALAAFYNQTIKSTIGLRGIMLQLRAEKCANVAEFGEMRLAFLEAVYKAKGHEMAVSLRDRLDQLLGAKPNPDPFDPR